MSEPFLYFDDIRPHFAHAGFKAPMDVCSICRTMDSEKIDLTFIDENNESIFYKVKQWLRTRRIISKLPKGRVLFLTMPTFYAVHRSFPVIKKRKMRMIGLVHDLHGLRFGDFVELKREIKKISCMDVVISHNSSFTDKLVELGVNRDKIIEIGLFDYLCEKPVVPANRHGIAFAGNLPKSVFLRKLPDSLLDCEMRLYGTPFQEHISEKAVFEGSYDSEAIVNKVTECKYGLIWDGDSVDTCSGLMGEYMRINNPHKLSLYIAAELPVITWKEAAIAKFVEDNGIGICVSSLNEVSAAIANIDDKRYNDMRNRLSMFGEKIRKGYFLRSSIDKALKIISEKGAGRI